MKKTLLYFLAVSLLASCASLTSMPENEKSIHPVVYQLPGMTRQQIFYTSKLWIAEKFVSAKKTIDFEDQVNGILIVKGIIRTTSMMFTDVPIDFSMKIEIQDERLRVSYAIGGVSAGSTYGASHGENKQSIDTTKAKLGALSESLFSRLRNVGNKTW